MNVQFSSSALEKLLPYVADGTKQLKLLHDTEGCGCVLSGVPAMQLIESPSVDDALLQEIPLRLWHEPRHAVFFEPSLRIDYNTSTDSFSLKSDNQIYTLDLKLYTSAEITD